MKILCVLFFLLNIGAWTFTHSNFKNFFDLSSFIIVILPLYFAISYRHGWRSLFNLKFHTDVWVKSEKEQDDLLKTIAYTALLTGALGMTIGLVPMYLNLSHPLSFGPSMDPFMRISLLTSIYALLVFLVVVLIYFVGREDEK